MSEEKEGGSHSRQARTSVCPSTREFFGRLEVRLSSGSLKPRWPESRAAQLQETSANPDQGGAWTHINPRGPHGQGGTTGEQWGLSQRLLAHLDVPLRNT